MKLKQRALTLLLSVAMLVTFMPALAFAEDAEDADQPVVSEEAEPETAVEADTAEADELEAGEAAAEKAMQTKEAAEEHAAEITQKSVKTASSAAKPVSIEYDGITGEGYINTKHAWTVPGEKAWFTVTFSNNTTKTFKYMEGMYDDDEEEWTYDEGWYLDGDYSKEYLGDDEDAWIGVDVSKRIKEGDNNSGTLYYGENIDDEYFEATSGIAVTGIKEDSIKSVEYTRNGSGAITGIVNRYEKRIDYLQDDDGWTDYSSLEGDQIKVTYLDDDEETSYTYTCQYVEDEDDEDESGYYFAYKDEDDDWRYMWPAFCDDQVDGEWTWASGSTQDVYVSYEGVTADTKLKVKVPEYVAIESVELKLKDGFEPIVSIGQNDTVSAFAFFKSGNSVVATYNDGSTKEFTFKDSGSYYGFYNGSNELYFYSDIEDKGITLEKDVPVNLTFTVYVEDDDDYEDSEFEYTVTAKKYILQVTNSGKKFQYTGKKITAPKPVVKTLYGGKTVSTDVISYTLAKKKAIGLYLQKITIKDTDNYMSDFGEDYIYSWYSIAPKKATIKKAKAGKKSFTVTWKKLSKKEQKQVSGFVIEYSLHKDFSDSKIKTAKKGKTSLTVKKGLKANKKYYVRVYTYKKTKTGTVYSKASKTKTVKTKK